MTVRLELNSEVEAALADQAKAKGISLQAYLQNAMENLAQAHHVPRGDAKRLLASLDKLAEMGKDLPHLPSSVFSRESIYQDHN